MNDPRRQPAGAESAAVWLLAASGLALRLGVAYFWIGSTDVKRWLFFSNLIEQGAYRDLYFNENPLWNHPAPMILFLDFVRWISRAVPFHFALKLLPAVADAGSIALVGLLGRARLEPRRTVLLAASYAFSPAAVIVSGFHGNTDPIMSFFVLSAAASFGSRPTLSALLLGAALSTKYTPFLLLPLFLFKCPDLKGASKFLLLTLAPWRSSRSPSSTPSRYGP